MEGELFWRATFLALLSHSFCLHCVFCAAHCNRHPIFAEINFTAHLVPSTIAAISDHDSGKGGSAMPLQENRRKTGRSPLSAIQHDGGWHVELLMGRGWTHSS
eukprot:GGOE01052368.1.p2 GENE.GGOE01052368.1~~GGOE01052368.1.p2  ORF type:complete len:121 (-),score=5.15 GGOE01052368.1:235-543(-)